MTSREFYTDEYNGAVIPDKATFNRIVIEAAAFVDGFIVSETAKALLENEAVLKKYNNAVCAVCDVVYNQQQNKDIASESVGNHSVSYVSKNESEKTAEKRNKVLTFLQGTGLLYRGLS